MDPGEPDDHAIKASPDARAKHEKPARSPSPEAKMPRAESTDSEDELLIALAKPGPPPLPPPSAPPEDMNKDEDMFDLEDMVPHAQMEADDAKPKRVVRKARTKTKQQQKDELKEQCAAKVAAIGIDHNRDFQARARAPMPTGHWTKFQEALVLTKPLRCRICRDLRDEFTTPAPAEEPPVLPPQPGFPSTATAPAACGAASTCPG